MKLSITHGGVKSSISHPDGEEFAIGDVLTQLVTPVLLAAGFSQEIIERGYGAVGAPAASPPPTDGILVRLPDPPEGFVFLGVIGATEDFTRFSSKDLFYLGRFKWSACSSFNGRYPYAAREGSPAHEYAKQHYPQTPQ